VEAVAGAVPVTVKIRSGWNAKTPLSWKEAAEAALDAGAAAITLHPRTQEQGYEGKSRWDLLADLAELVHASRPGIPVFGSGDLFTPESARDMLAETGCDGVMFARGAMGNPFIFTQTKQLLLTGAYGEIPIGERLNAGWRELIQLVADAGENSACREMRKRFCAYSKGIEGGAALRMELVHAETVSAYREIFTKYGFTLAG
jgi:nifR3 family TIM-barrel protein